MLEVIALITFHELHLHPVFYRCCTQTQLKGQTEETRLRDPSELLIFGMRITSIHCYKGGTRHLYALVVIFIENQEATRVWSRAKRKFSNTFPWDMFFKWSHKCINQQKCFCVTYLYQRWCRRLGQGHRGPQQNLNRATLSLCSLQLLLDETVAEISRHKQRGLVYTKVCDMEQQWSRDSVPSLFNQTDGYPVTWVVTPGQTPGSSTSFADLLAG